MGPRLEPFSFRFTPSHLALQGPTNIFDKTCPWASGMQKALAQQDELVVQYLAEKVYQLEFTEFYFRK